MRYSGKIGYFETVETKPGLYEDKIVFRKAQGDVVRNIKREQSSSEVNEKIAVNNSISVVADPYSREHFFNIVCVEWQGALWKISSVTVEYPRIILEIGGLYDEELE